MSANQRFESEDGKPATNFALCEPHERMLNGTFLHTLSTPFSTANATYHGEIWLAEHLGVLGVQSQVQAQELAPRTAVMAIKPRFLLVNKLDEAVQFHGVQMKEAPARVAGKPHALGLAPALALTLAPALTPTLTPILTPALALTLTLTRCVPTANTTPPRKRTR